MDGRSRSSSLDAISERMELGDEVWACDKMPSRLMILISPSVGRDRPPSAPKPMRPAGKVQLQAQSSIDLCTAVRCLGSVACAGRWICDAGYPNDRTSSNFTFSLKAPEMVLNS